MADNLSVTAGSGSTIGMDEVVDGTLGTVKVGFGKIMDGTLDSTNKLIVTAAGAAKTDGSAVIQPVKTDQTTHGTTDLVAADITKLGGAVISATNPVHGTVSDGTNEANVLKSDGTAAGNNALLTAPAVQTLIFTTSASGAQTILANTDVSHYSWIEVVYTSVGSGLALTGQFSTVSGGTYVNQGSFTASAVNTPGALGVAVNTIYASPIRGNFFQIAVSALTSGTFAGTVTLRSAPPWFGAVIVSGNIASSTATGSAYPANDFAIGVKALTASPAAATTGNLVAVTGDVMGEALVTTGGLVTTSVPANASNVVVKASPGRLCRVLVTTTGVTAMQIFDNATTNSGTIIGALPASAAIGGVYDFEMPAAAGITIAGSATNPAVTVSWI